MSIIVRPAVYADLPAILAIYNDAVANTTAIWNETPSDLAGRTAWFEERIAAGFPVLVADEDGMALGYATYGPFRPHEGYRHTAELSIYVRADLRGRGVGKALLGRLVDEAAARGVHVLVGGIEAANESSIRLHAAFGFQNCGVLPQVGTKFGRWLDLLFMVKVLDGNAPPAPKG
ncbi:N-acetyltransferase family protein [Pseudoxanthobacter sp.]|uniref:GNAT family N-acetyltransferase n=1 Tax=Pseudoxanthobacter sp. TaxID=1925742 RepID=UPI002FE10E56